MGRFNQSHTAQHQITEVKPVPTSLHFLQSLHPELSLQEIQTFIEHQFQTEEACESSEDNDSSDSNGETEEESMLGL